MRKNEIGGTFEKSSIFNFWICRWLYCIVMRPSERSKRYLQPVEYFYTIRKINFYPLKAFPEKWNWGNFQKSPILTIFVKNSNKMSKMQLDKEITHIKIIPPVCRKLFYDQKNKFLPLESISWKMKLRELSKKSYFNNFRKYFEKNV